MSIRVLAVQKAVPSTPAGAVFTDTRRRTKENSSLGCKSSTQPADDDPSLLRSIKQGKDEPVPQPLLSDYGFLDADRAPNASITTPGELGEGTEASSALKPCC